MANGDPTQRLPWSLPRIPLRLVLILPFLLQVLGAVGLVGYLSWRNGQQAIYELAHRLMGEVSDRIETELSDHVGQATQVNRLNAEAIAQGMLNLNDPDRLNRYFLEQIQTFTGLTAIYWSTEAGTYVGAEHRPDGDYALGVADAVTTNGHLEIYSIDRQNRPAKRLHTAPYDPRTRPWYQLAVARGHPTWTEIFVWSPLVNMSIDTVQPIYDQGQLQGVLGVSLGLLDISQFLRQLDLGASGETFIVEPATGKLVATSTAGNPYQVSSDGATAERLPIKTSQLPLLTASAHFLQTRFGPLNQIENGQQLDFWVDGDRHFLQVMPLEEIIGLDWLLITVVPESDFTAQINANTRTTLMLSLAALLLAITIGLLTARWVLRPILQLNQAARDLSHGCWHNPTIAANGIQEMEELATSFSLMAAALKGSFALLEQKVNMRTAELAESNQQLAAAKEKAETANLTKSRFIANMSHELRTPLNAILGFTQLMQRSAQSTALQRTHLDIINRSGEHLLSLINDVLAISKIEAGHITLLETRFDLYRVLQTLEDLFRIEADAKGLTLQVMRSPHLPRYLQADVGKLRQILMNLLSNALKFTQRGSVVLRVSELEAPDRADMDRDVIASTVASPRSLVADPISIQPAPKKGTQGTPLWFRFEVEDTGPGVAPEQQEHLFEAFMHADAGHPCQAGIGLGLAICRDYSQLMGGRIDLQVTETPGALFRVELPMQLAAAQPDTPPCRVVGLAAHQPPLRILVVDDQPVDRQLLKELLSSVGFQVRTAEDGTAAIANYRCWQPHLIWMDMNMPVLDGYEVTQRIRAMQHEDPGAWVHEPESPPPSHPSSPCSPPLKIIALTASAFEADRAKILAAGCDDCVHKPYQAQEIFNVLAEHLGVTYRYQTDERSDWGNLDLRSPPLWEMSADWIQELQQASIEADRDWLIQLIAQVPQSCSDLKGHLTQLVDQLDFDALVELAETQTHAEAR
ncbi:MAG: response regulator [Leptolyngbya sp. SIO1E4]|nr:response regulator [Leptolyngbya sp. SIO1E4]